jgi:hypothetical protein
VEAVRAPESMVLARNSSATHRKWVPSQFSSANVRHVGHSPRISADPIALFNKPDHLTEVDWAAPACGPSRRFPDQRSLAATEVEADDLA